MIKTRVEGQMKDNSVSFRWKDEKGYEFIGNIFKSKFFNKALSEEEIEREYLKFLMEG